jgi:hypothetical protein
VDEGRGRERAQGPRSISAKLFRAASDTPANRRPAAAHCPEVVEPCLVITHTLLLPSECPRISFFNTALALPWIRVIRSGGSHGQLDDHRRTRRVEARAHPRLGIENTSVNAVLASYLERWSRSDELRGRREEAVSRLTRLAEEAKAGSGGRTWSRDELHERSCAVPRHEERGQGQLP